MKQEDIFFMHQALREAEKTALVGEVPIGAALVAHGEIIARAHNTREQSNNPLDHAEMVLLQQASRHQGNWRLNDTTLYVTLEPCPMCLGALFQARVRRLVYGCPDPKREKENFFPSLSTLPASPFTLKSDNHLLTIEKGVLEKECSQILKEFFEKRRI